MDIIENEIDYYELRKQNQKDNRPRQASPTSKKLDSRVAYAAKKKAVEKLKKLEENGIDIEELINRRKNQ